MEFEDLVVRPPVSQASPREPRREPARQVGSKSAKDRPWQRGYVRENEVAEVGSQVSPLAKEI
jgi:hypothetical protein